MPSFQACEICGEPFEQFWDEDEEEWHLKDALRIKERTYHPVCYEDFKEVIVDVVMSQILKLGACM